MKERPIPFSGEMVRAILEGRKTQTRRVMRPQPEILVDLVGGTHEKVPCLYGAKTAWYPCRVEHAAKNGLCPYGVPGDRLWVKETWQPIEDMQGDATPYYRADGEDIPGPWKSGRFMPKKYARIWLEITGVRVERVQEISAGDVKAEGVQIPNYGPDYDGPILDPWSCFAELWDSLNAKRGFGWDANPWVWVIEFSKMVEK